MTAPSKPSQRRNFAKGPNPLAGAVLLVVVLLGLLFWRQRIQRGTPEQEAADDVEVPGFTPEAARDFTQKMVEERANDPVYQAALDAIADKRRGLGSDSLTLQTDTEAWQRRVAATNMGFAVRLEFLSRLQSGATNDAARTALSNAVVELDAIMASDPEGAALLTRRTELEKRRATIDLEARQTIGRRIRRQIDTPPTQSEPQNSRTLEL